MNRRTLLILTAQALTTSSAAYVLSSIPALAVSKKAPHPVDVHVGSRVRLRRMMLGMTQEKLGESLGITYQQIQKYEKGTNRIGASRLQHIATILKVPVAFFFEDAPGVPEKQEGFD